MNRTTTQSLTPTIHGMTGVTRLLDCFRNPSTKPTRSIKEKNRCENLCKYF